MSLRLASGINIPLNPPFSKGENRFPHFRKRGMGEFETGFSHERVQLK